VRQVSPKRRRKKTPRRRIYEKLSRTAPYAMEAQVVSFLPPSPPKRIVLIALPLQLTFGPEAAERKDSGDPRRPLGQRVPPDKFLSGGGTLRRIAELPRQRSAI